MSKELAVAEQIRSFNRFYTEAIGSLDEQHEGLDVTLAESRALFTVATLDSGSVNEAAQLMGLDLAYTSRILGSLEDRKLIRRTISPTDRRQRVVKLTAKGDRILDEIKNRSNQRVLALVSHLTSKQVRELLSAMTTIQDLINPDHSNPDP